MSVIIKDAHRIVNNEGRVVENLDIDFSKAGSKTLYLQSNTGGLMHDIIYKSNNPNITITGPKTLASGHNAPLVISWEPCDADICDIEVLSKVR